MNNILRRAAARIAENEFWLLWVYGVPFVLSSNLPRLLLYAALATIPLFWIARRVARGVWSVRTPLDLPLALLLGLGIIGVAVSNERTTSISVYAEWVGGAALYYGIVNSTTPTRMPLLVRMLLVLGVVMAGVGLLGVNFSDKFLPVAIYPFLPKVDFSFLNPRGFAPNIVAGAIAPIVPLALAWTTMQGRVRRAVLTGTALVLLAVIILTQSRGALLGLVVAFGILSVWHVPRLIWLAPVVALVLVLGLIYIGPAHLAEIVLVSDSNGSAGGRLELWDRALRMFQDFPFTGIGLGTFESTVLTLFPLLQNNPGAPVPHAHNLYLEMGADFGVGGFVAFLGLVTAALGTAMQNVKRARTRFDSVLAIGLLAGYVTFLLHSVLDAVAVSTKVAVVIWMLLALIVAQARTLRREP